MDKLDTIFAMQAGFEEKLMDARDLRGVTREEWLQKITLAMVDELSELINEINYKWWKNPKPIDDEAVKGELVDILHFFTSMCLKMDMTAEELFARYVDKNRENHDRQEGKSEKPGYSLSELRDGI